MQQTRGGVRVAMCVRGRGRGLAEGAWLQVSAVPGVAVLEFQVQAGAGHVAKGVKGFMEQRSNESIPLFYDGMTK